MNVNIEAMNRDGTDYTVRGSKPSNDADYRFIWIAIGYDQNMYPLYGYGLYPIQILSTSTLHADVFPAAKYNNQVVTQTCSITVRFPDWEGSATMNISICDKTNTYLGRFVNIYLI
jgi:hypothetical protein